MPRPRLLVAEQVDGLTIDLLQQLADVLQTDAASDPQGTALALGDAEVLFCVGLRVDGALLGAAPKLRLVLRFGVGLDNIDLEACRARGVAVGYTPGANAATVAEYTLGLILGLLHRYPWAWQALTAERHQHDWTGWKRWVGADLRGKTVGIVGFGNIGRRLATLLAPFRCRVLATDPLVPPETVRFLGVEPMPLEALLAQSLVVSLHVPLLPSTHHLMDARRIATMPRGSYLVNTSRGEVVDARALADALRSGHLAGAALDVLEGAADPANPLWDAPNLIVAPHIASATEDALQEIRRMTLENLQDYLQTGQPRYPAFPR